MAGTYLPAMIILFLYKFKTASKSTWLSQSSETTLRFDSQTKTSRKLTKTKNTVILYALFTKDMSSEPLKIDIEKVVKEKAPKYAKKFRDFFFATLNARYTKTK